MAIQLAVSTRNARLDAIETEIGASPILKLIAGSLPADCAAADPGTIIATMTLAAGTGGDWLAAAAGGSKAKSGTWQDASADNPGTITHFRIYDSGGSVCHMQGTCAVSSADMIIDNATVTLGQVVNITGFTLTDGNP